MNLINYYNVCHPEMCSVYQSQKMTNKKQYKMETHKKATSQTDLTHKRRPKPNCPYISSVRQRLKAPLSNISNEVFTKNPLSIK